MMPFATYNIPEAGKKETTQNNKWLWIVIDQALSTQQEELLRKICEALKADFSKDVQLIVYDADKGLSISSFNMKETKLVLSFGIPPSALGVWIDLNSPGIRFLEAYGFILSVPIDELLNHPASKKLLWSSMQTYIQRSVNPQ